MARFVLRKAPVGVELVRGRHHHGPGPGPGPDHRQGAHPSYDAVTGAPGELALWTTGRRGAAQVRLDGTEAAVRTLRGSHWSL